MMYPGYLYIFLSRKSPSKFGIHIYQPVLETEHIIEKGLRHITPKKSSSHKWNHYHRCITVEPINTIPLAFLEATTLTEPAEINTTEIQDEPHSRKYTRHDHGIISFITRICTNEIQNNGMVNKEMMGRGRSWFLQVP